MNAKKLKQQSEFICVEFGNGNEKRRRTNWFRQETALDPSSGNGLGIARKMLNKQSANLLYLLNVQQNYCHKKVQ